jgi:hypothetical protein
LTNKEQETNVQTQEKDRKISTVLFAEQPFLCVLFRFSSHLQRMDLICSFSLITYNEVNPPPASGKKSIWNAHQKMNRCGVSTEKGLK